VRRSAIFLLLTLLAVFAAVPLDARAQSADQEVVSVADAPDPVTPGNDITYTVTVRNNGPDPATNGGLNVNLGGGLTLVSANAPAGFTCTAFGNSITCNTPSFAVSTVVITIVAKLDASLVSFPDGSVSSNFFPSGTTVDPNNGNNSKSAVTAYDTPQIDLVTTVSDSPDPVGPGQNLTYSVVVSNNGPDTAGSTNFGVYNNGTLPFVSGTAPAGFSCVFPPVGAAPQFNCTAATVPPGSYNFTVVVRVDSAILGVNDGSVSTFFGTNGVGNDTNQNNNGETEVTQYVTPDANMAVPSVADSPDPSLVDATFDYLVTVSNVGPDPASEARLNVYNNGTLQFVSVDAPVGFPCAAPAVGAAPVFTCSATSLAVGSPVQFVISVRAPANNFGPNGGTVQTAFVASSGLSDPNNANNTWTETTTIRTNDLFKDGFE
jgi:uncharacterized repeat protein (TIGR01451 family)